MFSPQPSKNLRFNELVLPAWRSVLLILVVWYRDRGYSHGVIQPPRDHGPSELLVSLGSAQSRRDHAQSLVILEHAHRARVDVDQEPNTVPVFGRLHPLPIISPTSGPRRLISQAPGFRTIEAAPLALSCESAF
eukprot:SAG25_NODE_1513_length_2865_cov_3.743312_2_plen_134_part_00